MTEAWLQVVDELGETIGEVEKLAAHEGDGIWHRAVSVFLFDAQGRLLIQQRAAQKYHFGAAWANSCCSHPTTVESPLEAASRALRHELGVVADLQEIGVVRYESRDSVSGLIEKEHDHVFSGVITGQVVPNPNEVQAVRWVALDDLRREISEQPELFAPWLPIILHSVPITR